VPSAAITTLRGGDDRGSGPGERIKVRTRRGVYAWARLPSRQYFDQETGIAFVGDTAGVTLHSNASCCRQRPAGYRSGGLAGESGAHRALDAETLFLTHFGPAAPSGRICRVRSPVDVRRNWRASLDIEGKMKIVKPGSRPD
jgi:hypothetical protein